MQNNTLTKINIGQGINFYSAPNNKFRTAKISVNFIVPLKEETVSSYALLPLLLRKGHKELPDFTLLNRKLAELYGASLDADVTKIADKQIIQISITVLGNKFTLAGEDIMAEAAQLLADIVLKPNINGGSFDEKDTALEKQYLIDSIEAEINDKRVYSVNKCIQIMCQGQPNALNKYGTVAGAQVLTAKGVAQAYQNLLETAEIAVIFSGFGDSAHVQEVLKKAFAGARRNPKPLTAPASYAHAALKEEHEIMELSQAKLVFGFKMKPTESLKETYAKVMFAQIYGGTPFSKLFLNAREKLSLCYYCSASYDRVNDHMLVSSGIELKNRQKATDEILLQLENVKKGEISAKEFENSKKYYKNALRQAADSLGSIESQNLRRIVWGKGVRMEEEIEIIDSLTINDIVKAANCAVLDTVYLLSGKEN